MSLNSIILPEISVLELYKKSLVEIKKAAKESVSSSSSPAVLGKNNKHIVILVANNETAFLPDDELNFLLGILSACKLNMDDVGIINTSRNKGTTYTSLSKDLKAEKVFLFGLKPEQIELPLSFPNYQLQQYNGQLYLSAPALSKMQNDKDEKMKLWNCLKKIFSI